jgi:hypothetical protein
MSELVFTALLKQRVPSERPLKQEPQEISKKKNNAVSPLSPFGGHLTAVPVPSYCKEKGNKNIFVLPCVGERVILPPLFFQTALPVSARPRCPTLSLSTQAIAEFNRIDIVTYPYIHM